MKYLVAVSGGIDSVVLLHILMHQPELELVVAHFDHGIRNDSAADARFVQALSESYDLPFVGRREALGPHTSEDQARQRRYAFLAHAARTHQATIVTAHHADDAIETIAINLLRGTGWRGLAVLDNQLIVRPLLTLSKADIYEYALLHRLEWVEDATNLEDTYLRNRLRRQLSARLSDKARRELLALWRAQCNQKLMIDAELTLFLSPARTYSRYFFTHIEPAIAAELIRAAVVQLTHRSPTRPQTERAVLAIKTTRPGGVCEIGDGVRLRFELKTFVVEIL